MHLRGRRRLPGRAGAARRAVSGQRTKSWHRGDYGTTAGHWPLDRYYRCNIVNNVPLKRSHGFISAQVTADLPRGTGQTHREPPCSPCISTYKPSLANPLQNRRRCLLLNIHSLT